jgi:CheY-like chemotaxis protein/HPt (histidine-containing phosphotransfer) domain-containing protein
MAKIEAGHINPKFEPFDLIGLVNTVQKTFELKASSKEQLIIVSEIDPAIEYLVKGDETLLNQVLLNLVGNAEKFTESGEIKIGLKISYQKEDKIFVEFEISDTGIGMPKENLELIFQKFKQIEAESKTKTKGTGLGLAIVKELLERMGGEIKVDSELGAGSVFTFILPFGYTEIKRKEIIEQLETISSGFDNKSILIVEDNLLNLKYAGKLLEKWGISQTHAFDGLQAVDQANKKHFDLILMDIQMPNLNGYEAAVQIRNTINPNTHTPILALTASAMVTEKNKATNAGMNGVLTKPFRPNELKELLDQYLGEVEKPIKSTGFIEKVEISNTKMKIDKSKLEELYGDDIDFKTMVFETFLEEIPSQVKELKSEFENENWEEVAKVAHKMKPSLGMVGLPPEEESLRIIESTIKKDGINDDIRTMTKEFVDSFPLFIELVKCELESI